MNLACVRGNLSCSPLHLGWDLCWFYCCSSTETFRERLNLTLWGSAEMLQVSCVLVLKALLEPLDATEMLTYNSNNKGFSSSPCAEWGVLFWRWQLCLPGRALDLTQGNDWKLVTNVWILQSFYTENLKSNENVYLLFYFGLFSGLILQLQRFN